MNIDRNKPVLFLDIDGVFGDIWLTRLYWIREDEDLASRFLKYRRDTGQGRFGDIVVKAAMELLITILRQYDVQVIVVSSWLSSYLDCDHEDVKEFSKFFGHDVLGSLNTTGGYSRGEAIKEFVIDNSLNTWIVIDDAKEQMYEDSDFFNNNHFIHTCGRFGFWLKEAEHLCLLLDDSMHDYEFGKKYHSIK